MVGVNNLILIFYVHQDTYCRCMVRMIDPLLIDVLYPSVPE